MVREPREGPNRHEVLRRRHAEEGATASSAGPEDGRALESDGEGASAPSEGVGEGSEPSHWSEEEEAASGEASAKAEGSEDERWRRRKEGGGPSGERGRIAWLMSFPNSGTSFTSYLVRRASNATCATNYGMETNPGEDGRSVPVCGWSQGGPYWLHPPGGDYGGNEGDDDAASRRASGTELGKSGGFRIPPPSAAILTKTHCGSRCAFCPPRRYLETPSSFLEMCLSGSRKVRADSPDGDGGGGAGGESKGRYEKRLTTYHPSAVERAVHLIRDPFDNVVSRFHHEQKEHRKTEGGRAWNRRYSNDAEGLRKWCADEDKKYAEAGGDADWAAYGHPADMTRRFEGVSCHGELLRYVQWHVLAVRAAEALRVPVLRVHYEDYSSDLRRSAEGILDFLGLDLAGRLPRFDSDKDYSAYFTGEERAAASDFMRELAGDAAGGLLERYWSGWDADGLRAQTRSVK